MNERGEVQRHLRRGKMLLCHVGPQVIQIGKEGDIGQRETLLRQPGHLWIEIVAQKGVFGKDLRQEAHQRAIGAAVIKDGLEAAVQLVHEEDLVDQALAHLCGVVLIILQVLLQHDLTSGCYRAV